MSTWKVEKLEVQSVDGLPDVVINVHWRVFGEANTAYGSVSLPMPTGDEFIPFNELTEAVVVGWAKSALGGEAVAIAEAAANTQPPAPAPALPWSSSTGGAQ